jgi:hypothetical protein
MVVLQDDASRGRMPVMGVRVGVVAGSRVITVRVGDTEIEARRLWCPRSKAQPSSSHLRTARWHRVVTHASGHSGISSARSRALSVHAAGAPEMACSFGAPGRRAAP